MTRKAIGRALLAVPLLLVLGGCDGRLVPVTAEFDRAFGFIFDSTLGTSFEVTLTQSEILGSLDIPDDAAVAFVDIQRVRLSLSPAATNEASSATLGFAYQGQPLTEDLQISLAELDDQPLDALVAGTLRSVERDMRAILAGDPAAPAEITMEGEVSDIAAAGDRLVMSVTLRVKATVSYEFCEEVGLGPFGPDAECTVP
jgi:hypothetical protein